MRPAVLCFGDSNTWGFTPGTGERFPENIRWTGILRRRLDPRMYVIEEGLNGRTTRWRDPLLPGRNGLAYLKPCLLSHQPLDTVILGLGTNDLKLHLRQSPEAIAGSVRLLRLVAIQAGARRVLVLGLPPIGALDRYLELFGADAERSARSVNELLRSRLNPECFVDTESIISGPGSDGIHLDASGHAALAQAIESRVAAPG
jgi:lysophospholipase L1-like esterase